MIGGSSAGASIQADYLVRGNPLGNVDAMSEGYERGFAFLPGTAVDQHFSQRNRMSDLISVVQKYPSLLGIGIDESTGVFVSGTVGEVVGAGNVYFISRQLAQYSAKKTDPELPTVTGESGDRFDLVELKRLN